MNDASGTDRGDVAKNFIEPGIRIGALLLLAVTCFLIIAPFIVPVIWATILAVAVYPAFPRIAAAVGGRERLAAALLVLIGFSALIVPTVAASTSMIGGMKTMAEVLQHGGLDVPPPPDRVANWPLIGDPVFRLWSLASDNLEAALIQLKPQLEVVGRWLASAMGGVGAGVLQFFLSILIAAVLLINADAVQRATRVIAQRVVGGKGPEFVALTAATVRSVAQGVLGVAVIQAVLAGLGMALAGVPAAGLWALLVLVLAVIQLPSLLVLGPVVLYVYSVSSTTVAVVFAIWSILVGSSDTFLKPLLLGRGLKIPMIVILIGAIGGMMAFGIIGLFVGAVVLALGYEIFRAWLGELPSALAEATGGEVVP
jgi:predicted PurR-regulated permease PerM